MFKRNSTLDEKMMVFCALCIPPITLVLLLFMIYKLSVIEEDISRARTATQATWDNVTSLTTSYDALCADYLDLKNKSN